MPSDTSKDDARRRPARRKRREAEPNHVSPDFVEALARGLSVMRCFRPEVKSLGNLELAQLTGLPKSTISRLVYTLTTLGYLRYHPDSGRYSPGYGVLALGFGCLANLEVRELARPLMETLAELTGGAVALGAFDGQRMTYTEAVHGSSSLYLRLPVGYRVGLSSTMGRAYLAAVPAQQRQALQPAFERDGLSDGMLKTACDEFEHTGCCFGIGDWQPGINAAAAAFSSLTGEGLFVLSCGGPANILSEARLREEVAPRLCDIVSQLSPPLSAPRRRP